MSEAAIDAARASGLLRPGEPLLVMVSGGGDSVALLDIAVRLGASVSALHVNYGLREDAAGDEDFLLLTEPELPLVAAHRPIHVGHPEPHVVDSLELHPPAPSSFASTITAAAVTAVPIRMARR
jgi:hypothetical protein